MRLVDFLICILQAHARTLQRLAALHGEEALLEMLESAGENPEAARPRPPEPLWFGRAAAKGSRTMASAYAELEHAVTECHLPAVLEFHLWAYPYYRAFIESPLDLNSLVKDTENNTDSTLPLVEEAVAQARVWIKRLPVPPEYAQQTESAAHVPWLRFRATVLRRMGKRPLDPIDFKE